VRNETQVKLSKDYALLSYLGKRRMRRRERHHV
jgi:hypothetical protein